MRIARVGSGTLSVRMLTPLLQSDHEVVAVLLDGRKTKGYRRWLDPLAARHFRGSFSLGGQARKHGIPIHYIDQMTEEEVAPLKALNLDLILVGGFSIILKKPLLDIPAKGCVNTHSSLLPRHRGPNPFSAAILAGDTETGVTFHWMDEDIDTGGIIAQFPLALNERSTMLGLYKEACELAGKKILLVVDSIADGSTTSTPQDPALATYEKKISEAESWIDWADAAAHIDRQVRGMSPQPCVRFRWRNNLVFVHRVVFDDTPVDAAPGTVVANRPLIKVATASGTLTIRVAFRKKPLPGLWPGLGKRPEVGEVLCSGSDGDA
ncbi:MAG: methionyl-tRNA formyltransferase [Candidatus Hydrogenedentes bacterium]|nr:methionyl-tRNA formyltransferase [Candidatus Hydrogenedentota bacterium]